MKIKQDFVTNSSSTTFIVAFPEKINSIDDVKKYIHRDDKAKQVFMDVEETGGKKIVLSDKYLLDELTIEMEHGFYGLDNYANSQDEFCKREGITEKDLYMNQSWLQSFYDERKNKRKKILCKKVMDFMKENEGNYVYIFNYSDEEGDFQSEMEHGGTFQSLPNITISKH